MWLIFKSAVVRKLGYVLVGLAVAFFFGHKAHATTFVYPAGVVGTTGRSTSQVGTGDAYCRQALAIENAAFGFTATLTSTSGQGPGAPSAAAQSVTCTFSSPAPLVSSPPSVAGAMSCSASSGNLDLLTVVGGSTGVTPGVRSGGMCYQGCEYLNSNVNLSALTAANFISAGAQPTGNTCGGTGSGATTQAVSSNNNCAIAAGVTACAVSGSGSAVVQNSGAGTFSVVAANVPSTSNTCVGYQDGGAACNTGNTTGVMQTPPGPSTAANTGTPAAPTVAVEAGTTGNVVNYYSPATVAASKGPVLTNSSGTGSPVGTALAPGGTGTGTSGSGPSAANGDCAASSVDCTGDGTLPSLARSDTIQSNVQDYWNAVQASPIVAAFSTISGSWPTASCPTVPFALSMFHSSQEFDAMAPVCTVWGNTVAPTLSLVFLALWAVQGIRVILSA